MTSSFDIKDEVFSPFFPTDNNSVFSSIVLPYTATSTSLIRRSCSMDGGAQQTSLLIGKEDNYGGIVLDLMEVEVMTCEDFDAKLDVSLKAWKDQGKRGIWIKLPNKLSNLVDTAIKRGFEYHHAEKEYVMLISSISEKPSNIPANASHCIGIGAFVLNKNQEMIVVKERRGYFKDKEVWKVPTGGIKEGEDIRAGAVRELKEETGIDAEFVGVLAFSEEHQAHWGRKSDIFFLCQLKPTTSFEIQKQDSEILDAKWMPIEEYVKQEYHEKEENKIFKLMANICLKRSQDDYSGLSTVLTTSTTSSTNGERYLYCSTDHAKELNGESFDPASTSTSL